MASQKSWLERAKLHSACSKAKAKGSRTVEVDIKVIEQLLQSHASLNYVTTSNRSLKDRVVKLEDLRSTTSRTDLLILRLRSKITKLSDDLRVVRKSRASKSVVDNNRELRITNGSLMSQVSSLTAQLKLALDKVDLLESAVRIMTKNPDAISELKAMGVILGSPPSDSRR